MNVSRSTPVDKLSRYSLFFALIFLGAGALGGGGLLILSPSGELMQIPLSVLETSPFESYLIPGIILFSVLGVMPLLLVFALLKKPSSRLAERLNLFYDMHWSWTFTIYLACTLIGWIQIQMIFFNSVHWLHTFYMFYGVAIIGLALLTPVRRYYQK